MLQPRVIELFRNLELLIPTFVQDGLDKRDVVYSFEFDKGDRSGVMCVYTNEVERKGVTDVPVAKDWFYDNKLWFRKKSPASLSTSSHDRYEAFISYLSDYQDKVLVDLKNPLLRLVIADVSGKDVPQPQQFNLLTA